VSLSHVVEGLTANMLSWEATMTRYLILSCSIAALCACGTANAQKTNLFRDNAFVGRDYGPDPMTALFAELTPQAAAPEQIDVIIFRNAAGVVAVLKDVPVHALPPSRWVYAAKPDLLPQGLQDKIMDASMVTFVVGETRTQAHLATIRDWKRYLPDRELQPQGPSASASAVPTGSCPNCAQSYLCHCVPELYETDVPEDVNYCVTPTEEACNEL